MTVGTEIGGRLADRSVVGTILAGMSAATAVLLLFTVTAHHPVTAAATIFLIGASGSLSLPALQTRLMDVAGDAQGLAAAGNHAALNVANAIGAFLGGLVLSAGYGYTAPAVVGALLGVGGLTVMVVARVVERRSV
jgi:DHA1 family inner membrane transport protein